MVDQTGEDTDDRWTLRASDRALAGKPSARAGASLGPVAGSRTRTMPIALPRAAIPDRLDRLVRSVVYRHEEALCAAVLTRLPAETAAGLDALLKALAADATGGEVSRAPLLVLRAGSGQ